MKHLLILISFLLLSSLLTSCEKKNGYGTETNKDGSTWFSGDKYVGEVMKMISECLTLSSFVNLCEKKNGYGTETYEDGSSYVGEWKDGIFYGQGT